MKVSYITNTRGGLNEGYRNQALGLVEMLEAVHSKTGRTTHIQEYDLSELELLAERLKKESQEIPHIVIAVADDGVEALKKLPRSPQGIQVLIGHEVPKNVEAVSGQIDFLAVPEHVTDCPDMDNLQIIRTQGVSHTASLEKGTAAFAAWEKKFPMEQAQPVIVVLLGGMVDGKHFHPQEAAQLARYVAAESKRRGAYVMATHSPRAQRESIEAFTQVLYDYGCDSSFFPFMPGKDHVPFEALLGAVAQMPRSRAIVTGDSVNMSCEAASVVKPSQLLLYPVTNQNPQNTKFVEWMRETGKSGVIEPHPVEPDTFIESPAQQTAHPLPMNAAHTIISAVYPYATRMRNRGSGIS